MGQANRGNRVRLKGLMSIKRADGAVHHYLRRTGLPLVRLPDLPPDDPDFLAAFAASGGALPTRHRRVVPARRPLWPVPHDRGRGDPAGGAGVLISTEAGGTSQRARRQA